MVPVQVQLLLFYNTCTFALTPPVPVPGGSCVGAAAVAAGPCPHWLLWGGADDLTLKGVPQEQQGVPALPSASSLRHAGHESRGAVKPGVRCNFEEE